MSNEFRPIAYRLSLIAPVVRAVIWRGVVCCVTLAAVESMQAQDPVVEDDPEAHEETLEPPNRSLLLDPVVVTATRLPQPLGEVPASISVVEQLDIQGAQRTVGLEEALDRVPGVLVQNSANFAQDVRIQIRGFGTRSPFGIREIRVLVDGLPETLPDGQTQLDSLDLGAVQRIEVLRGPAGALYGNAAGGVIQFFTEDAPQTPQAEVVLTGGSFGLGKFQLKGGGRAGNFQLFSHGSYLQLDGFRDHSRTQSGIITGKLRYDVSDNTGVTFLLNAVDSPTAQDPGALTREQVNADRRQARPLNIALDAGETIQQGRVGLVVNHHTDYGTLSAYSYALYRDFDGRLPILPEFGDGVVTLQRISPGAGVRHVLDTPLLGWRQSFTVGMDVQHQDDNRRRFQNNGGRRGALGLHQFERVTSIGPYVRETVYFSDALEVSAGARYDWVDFDVDVDFPSDSADSGSRTLDQWSPGGGIRYSPRSWLSVFTHIGTTFQVPTTTELADPDGPGFNPDIEPQTAVSYEIGARTEWGQRLLGGFSAYIIDIDDLLVPFESLSGRTAFRNAGRSRRYGLEIDWRAEVLPLLRWTGAVTLLKAEYLDFETAAGNFDGNDEPGIPPWWIYQELAYRDSCGLFAALEAFLVDGYFVDDANTARSPAYELLNLRAGYEYTLADWTIASFVGLNNLTDATYDGGVRLNARGGRFFEPAPGFNVYGGLAISARL